LGIDFDREEFITVAKGSAYEDLYHSINKTNTYYGLNVNKDGTNPLSGTKIPKVYSYDKLEIYSVQL
jgi:hypothetical protein